MNQDNCTETIGRGAAEHTGNDVPDPGDFLTVSEVAQILRIPRTRAYELVGRGEIQGVIRIGRSIRINRQIFLDSLHRQASYGIEHRG